MRRLKMTPITGVMLSLVCFQSLVTLVPGTAMTARDITKPTQLKI